MPPEAALLAYAGLAALALATRDHRRLAWPALGAVRPRVSRLAGFALLTAALVAATLRHGWSVGVVAWIGLSSIAGAGLVLTLSRRPRAAIGAGAPAAAIGLALLAARLT